MSRTETWYLCQFGCKGKLSDVPEFNGSSRVKPSDPVHMGELGEYRVMIYEPASLLCVKDSPLGNSISDINSKVSYEEGIRVTATEMDTLTEEIECSNFSLENVEFSDDDSQNRFDSITEAVEYSAPTYVSQLELKNKGEKIELLDYGKIWAEERIYIPELMRIIAKL